MLTRTAGRTTLCAGVTLALALLLVVTGWWWAWLVTLLWTGVCGLALVVDVWTGDPAPVIEPMGRWPDPPSG